MTSPSTPPPPPPAPPLHDSGNDPLWAACGDLRTEQPWDQRHRLHSVDSFDFSDLAHAVAELKRCQERGARAFSLYTCRDVPACRRPDLDDGVRTAFIGATMVDSLARIGDHTAPNPLDSRATATMVDSLARIGDHTAPNPLDSRATATMVDSLARIGDPLPVVA